MDWHWRASFTWSRKQSPRTLQHEKQQPVSEWWPDSGFAHKVLHPALPCAEQTGDCRGKSGRPASAADEEGL